ncbi:MAG: hypothetical protein E6Q97_32085 [Desulfurellales bacterium]|nr:MAG: hypothetical protein E6Q97_32085 [Desulfurellales bacterium]
METVAEIWRAIPDVDNYEASNLGRIRSVTRVVTAVVNGKERRTPRVGRMMSACRTRDGYLQVNLRDHGRNRSRLVHQLVAETFIGPRQKGVTVNHINGIKADNRPENLEYVSHLENMRHAYRMNLIPTLRGEGNGMAKIDEVAVKTIRNGRGVSSSRELAAAFGISDATVRAIWAKRSWKHIA